MALLLPEESDVQVTPADPLAADLKYMQQRRARESGIRRDTASFGSRADWPASIGEGRLELIPVLLMVEAIYARLGAPGWQSVVDEVSDVELLLPAAGRREHYLEQGVPMDLVSRMLGAADRLAGTGDLRSLAEIGEAMVKRGLARFCKELAARVESRWVGRLCARDLVELVASRRSRGARAQAAGGSPRGARSGRTKPGALRRDGRTPARADARHGSRRRSEHGGLPGARRRRRHLRAELELRNCGSHRANPAG